MPPAMQLLVFLRALLIPQAHLALENLALRQQVAVLKRGAPHLGGLHHSYRRAA